MSTDPRQLQKYFSPIDNSYIQPKGYLLRGEAVNNEFDKFYPDLIK